MYDTSGINILNGSTYISFRMYEYKPSHVVPVAASSEVDELTDQLEHYTDLT